jgi:hypothetical protein
VHALTVVKLENRFHAEGAPAEGEVVPTSQLATVVQDLLRERYWCRLAGDGAFVHVGYDFNMYVGLPAACPKAEQLASTMGLFVERFASPYAAHF